MNVSLLAADIAQRVPAMAEDCQQNNEILIAAIIDRHVSSTAPAVNPEIAMLRQCNEALIAKEQMVRVELNRVRAQLQTTATKGQ